MATREEELRNAGLKIVQGKKNQVVTQIDLTNIDPEYVGTFKFHRPSLMEQMRIGVLKGQFLGGLPNVDVVTDNIAHMVSTLQVVLDEAPNWFDPNNLDEYEVLDAVYERYMEFFRIISKRDSEFSNEGDSQESAE